jgi:hypothetical protein
LGILKPIKMFTRKNVKEDLNEDELYNKEKLNDEIKSVKVILKN